MAKNDLIKRLLDSGIAFTQMSQSKAEALTKDLVQQGEIKRKEAAKLVDTLVDRGRETTDRLVAMIQEEVARQIARVGNRVDDLEGRVEELAERMGVRAKPAPAASKAKAPARAAAASKAKAPVRAAAASKAKAPARAAAASRAKAPAAKRAAAAVVAPTAAASPVAVVSSVPPVAAPAPGRAATAKARATKAAAGPKPVAAKATGATRTSAPRRSAAKAADAG